jgi:hypothetical protein
MQLNGSKQIHSIHPFIIHLSKSTLLRCQADTATSITTRFSNFWLIKQQIQNDNDIYLPKSSTNTFQPHYFRPALPIDAFRRQTSLHNHQSLQQATPVRGPSHHPNITTIHPPKNKHTHTHAARTDPSN